jgi:hypothetical protein
MNKELQHYGICNECFNQFEQPIQPSTGKAAKRKYCDKCLPAIHKRSGTKRTEDYYLDSKGYALVRINGRFIHEHRYVMEQKLGRKLNKAESVHHINGIRHDNSPDNLELWVGPIRYGQRAADIKCHNCGHSYKID